MLGTFRNWVDIVGRALAREGIDLAAELAADGVDLSRICPDGGRLAKTAVKAIWHVVDTRSNDPVFGLSMLRAVDYLDFEDLGVALVATGSAEAVLARAVRYHSLVSDSLTITLSTGTWLSEVCIDHHRTHWRAAEFSAAVITRILRARFGTHIHPAEVHLGFDSAPGLEAYRRYYRCPVVGGAAVTRLTFERAQLARCVRPHPVAVADRFEQVLRDRVDELTRASSAAGAVTAAVRQMFGTDVPTLARAAAALHVSERTLQRQLAAEGTTFGSVLDNARRQVGLDWLEEGRLSRTEIAYLLGFSQPSSLSRAVRRWSSAE